MGGQVETNWNDALQEAIRNRDLPAFEAALENGADVNARLGANRTTALHLAVPSGSYDIVRTLLRAGANPNNQTLRGFTPLFSASGFVQADMANLLLDWGVDPGIYTKSGISNPPFDKQAIHEAVRKHKPEVVRALLRAGADPLAVEGSSGKSVLDVIPDYASAHYNFLRDAGQLPRVAVDESLCKADIMKADELTGQTPLDNPVTWRKWPEITAILASKGEAFTKDELLAPNTKGEPYLLAAADARMLRAVVEGLNAQGEALGLDELEQAGITNKTTASLSHIFRQLACESNIRLQGAARFRQSLQELPAESAVDITNRHQLAAITSRLMRGQEHVR